VGPLRRECGHLYWANSQPAFQPVVRPSYTYLEELGGLGK